MKKLSINIPTFNRDVFLMKNLGIIIDQLYSDGLTNYVEINISDNASSDNTKEIVEEIIKQNQDITITYFCNEKNIGPDLNFIAAMQMAHGEYSILFGDDDFFVPGAIKHLIETVEANKDVDIFFANRISVNTNGVEIGRQKFMCEDLRTEVFDFTRINDGRAFLSLVNDHGGILTFISSEIYKTAILKEVGECNPNCIGSCYSFLYYFWNKLASGGKIMYLDEYLVQATTMGVTNNNYGQGMKRLLVDTEGLSCIANIVFIGAKAKYKSDFLAAVRSPIGIQRIMQAYFSASAEEKERFVISSKSCGWSESDLKFISYLFNQRNGLKIFLKKILPLKFGNKIKI